jgi:D-alanine-D-alanine ligase-like ATP-grasp enzyme
MILLIFSYDYLERLLLLSFFYNMHIMGEPNGSTSLRVALISEQRSNYLQLGYSEEDCAALTHDGEIQAVLSTLKKLGHQVTLVPGIESLVQQLAAGKHKCWDLAFNMAQGFHGPARESQVPALLGAYQVPHTFADAATMALCQNKANTKVDTPGSLPGNCLRRSRLTNSLQP